MEGSKQHSNNSEENRNMEHEGNSDQEKYSQNKPSSDADCEDTSGKKEAQDEEDQGQQGHNPIEKFTFVLGLVVMLGLFSFLIYQWSTKTNAPPELVITTAYQPQMKHYGFKIDVENIGDETAEAANIEFSLYQEGKPTESGTMEFQYIAVKSKETGWLVFHTQRKPEDSLVVSSITYTKP